MQTAESITWSGYSEAERDRRWTAVRAGAAAAGFDCIFLPVCLDRHSFPPSQDRGNGSRSDSRYLTQLEGVSVVLPTDGRTPIVIGERIRPTRWITDVRGVSRTGMSDSWAGPMASALLDVGMEHARVGVVALNPGRLAHARALDGVVNHTAYAGTMAQLPHASFEDATDIVGAARYVKGDEEIACLRRAAATAAAGIDALVEVARPGLPEATLYARGMRRLLELGSEYFPLTLHCEPPGQISHRYRSPHLEGALGSGWVIGAEVNAVWGGQVAQETQSVVLGPVPEMYRTATEVQRDAFSSVLDYLTPGRDLADLGERINRVGERHGLRPSISLQSAGYGDDGPLLRTGEALERLPRVRVEPGTVWTCQIRVHGDDGPLELGWGTSLLVNEGSPVRLANREPELISIE